MNASFGRYIPFSQAKIDHIDKSLLIFTPDDEVVGLNVAMEESFFLDGLEAVDNLDANIKDRNQAELLLPK